MTVDEGSRHALYLKLEEVLGREEATTLMEHLPPVGWADVATKRDLEHLAEINKREHDQLEENNGREHAHLAETFRLELQALGDRLKGDFRKELIAQTRTFVLTMIGFALTGAGIAVGAARAL